MAVKDFKKMTAVRLREGVKIGVYDNVENAVTDTLIDMTNNVKTELVIVVELKRRQSLESYKSQFLKMIEAKRFEFESVILKKGFKLKKDFTDSVVNIVSGVENVVELGAITSKSQNSKGFYGLLGSCVLVEKK